MQEHLARKAADWFTGLETWNSFVELISLKNHIEVIWLTSATEKLRSQFANSPCNGWDFQAWDNSHDTWWFLQEFGPASIGIGFGWRYYFCFRGDQFGQRISSAMLKQTLDQEIYRPLVVAFGRKDQPIQGSTLEQYGDFHFGSPSDGNLLPHELAWYAGNMTREFVEQAAAKIKAYTCNQEITELLRKLNTELISPKGSWYA